MIKASLTTLPCIAVLALLPATAHAAIGERACEPFSISGPLTTVETAYVDIDGKGSASTGDKQLGQIELVNDAGDQMGERSWVITVLDLNDDGSLQSAFAETISSFYDGAIYTVTKIRDMPANSFEDGQLAVEWSELTSPITGGTGTFQGAKGSVTTKIGTDTISYSFDLDCD
ncbi:MAG: hypothetical protein AAGC96_05840 [Pseudomonadota bacterium]